MRSVILRVKYGHICIYEIYTIVCFLMTFLNIFNVNYLSPHFLLLFLFPLQPSRRDRTVALTNLAAVKVASTRSRLSTFQKGWWRSTRDPWVAVDGLWALEEGGPLACGVWILVNCSNAWPHTHDCMDANGTQWVTEEEKEVGRRDTRVVQGELEGARGEFDQVWWPPLSPGCHEVNHIFPLTPLPGSSSLTPDPKPWI